MEYIGGVDEAGRGPVFGPIVVVAAVQINGDEDDLRTLGVRDSKRLSPSRRKEILSHLSRFLEWSTTVVSAEEIDEYRRRMTMNEMEVLLFAKTIDALVSRIDARIRFFVDAADVNEQRFAERILASVEQGDRINIVSRHKADDIYPIVGAASIIAKVTRDEYVEIIEEELRKKLDMPLGSGYPSDPITRRFLREYIRRYGKVPRHVRTSWKTVKNMLKEEGIEGRKQSTLEHFTQ